MSKYQIRLLTKKQIKSSQKELTKISSEIKKQSSFHYLGSDPTRLKIIFLFKFYSELCPTDFSQILNISISAISHQLRLLENTGLVEKIKMGKIVCYTLSNKGKEFFKVLNLD